MNLLIIAALAVLAPFSHATSLDQFTLMALSPADDRAVVKNETGALSVLKSGEVLPGTSVVVRQILPDRLMLEETVDGEAQGSRQVQTVWMHRAEGGKSRIERPQENAAAAHKPVPVVKETPLHPPAGNKAKSWAEGGAKKADEKKPTARKKADADKAAGKGKGKPDKSATPKP